LRFGPEDNNTKSEATSGPASRDPADKLNTWWGDMLFFKQLLLEVLPDLEPFPIRPPWIESEAGGYIGGYKSE
jgi:hypothetical protein